MISSMSQSETGHRGVLHAASICESDSRVYPNGNRDHIND